MHVSVEQGQGRNHIITDHVGEWSDDVPLTFEQRSQLSDICPERNESIVADSGSRRSGCVGSGSCAKRRLRAIDDGRAEQFLQTLRAHFADA